VADYETNARNIAVREKYVQFRRPDCSGQQVTACKKIWMKLCVLHLGFCYKAVFANVIHVAFLFSDLFSADFLLLAGLVVLHRCCPYVSILADEIQVTLFAHNFFFSNFGSHLNTSKPQLGFDNER